MAISAGLDQGYSSGGSYGYNIGGSINSGQNMSQGWSASGTDAMTARQWSMLMSDIAWERDLAAMQMQMDYNSKEAKTQREWQERMANSIYTRSAKNMKEAGINPILAYSMGLSGAGVGSGATASLGGVPSAPLAQNFMDSWSASQSNSMGYSSGESWNTGQSSSWNQSESGLVTALSAFGEIIGNAISNITSAQNIETIEKGIKGLFKKNSQKLKDANKAVEHGKEWGQYSKDYPHEPGRPGSSASNMYFMDMVKNFAEDIKDKFK